MTPEHGSKSEENCNLTCAKARHSSCHQSEHDRMHAGFALDYAMLLGRINANGPPGGDFAKCGI